ncbi:site-specific DNA-methyltransferase [Anthocerotibacter panamensis]|uniref:site-specific DNA-methyltransferase n=1 Tax=Anthocerotibacter panamensis TaxID=2857077 RepID=UPI001C40218C|nr:site-specific DNA-methyltransferase [Anthocerotibacter panamensis]
MPLSDAEKTHLKALIDRDEPLPLHYRDRLFAAEIALVWPDKTRPPAPEIPDLIVREQIGPCREGWVNRLLWGDNRLALAALQGVLKEPLMAVGGVKLIYIDPPFASGLDFAVALRVGDTKVSQRAYRDGLALDIYLGMMYERLVLMREILSDEGSIYVHCDWRVSAHLRLVMDEIFGRAQFQNEICWAYRSQGAGRRRYARKHDTILFYTKSDRWTFHPETERSYMQHRYGFAKEDFKLDEAGRQYRDALVRDVWEIPALQSATRERWGYDTQKPEALLRRILACSSNPGDLVADFFCGSGTTLAVAQQLGRKWLGCDESPYALHTARKRLSSLSGFEILHLVSSSGGGPAPLSPGGIELQPIVGVSPGGESTVQIQLKGFYPAQPLASLEAVKASLKPGQQTLVVVEGQGVRLHRPRQGACTQKTLTHTWSDWIDYWAVDFTSEESTVFCCTWQSFRTRQQPALELTSRAYRYPKPGRYAITVQVIDLFGQETREVIRVDLTDVQG